MSTIIGIMNNTQKNCPFPSLIPHVLMQILIANEVTYSAM